MEDLELNVAIGAGQQYRLKTEIKVPKIGWNYYLPTDYKEPLKVKLIDYTPTLSVNNLIRIMARVYSENDKWYDVQPELLFKSKDKASEKYLQNKNITFMEV